MSALARGLAAALLLAAAGCILPATRGECRGEGRDASTGTTVHVELLNDANVDARICYRIGEGAVHAIDAQRASTQPNVKHAYDGVGNGTQLELQAWRAGDDAIFHAASASDHETWFVIDVLASGLRIDASTHQPAFD